jgi:hypothetical protein
VNAVAKLLDLIDTAEQFGIIDKPLALDRLQIMMFLCCALQGCNALLEL